MFTDIADYSKSVAKMSRKESEEMLNAHDRILHKVIRQYKGKWIKSIGDAFLVVFRSPTDAALCAMAMHDSLWEEMKVIEDDSKHIRIRVALNLGEVRLTRNDVFGEAVNIAARLESVTPADNIYLTESVYLSMNKAEVLAVKEGSERFKGCAEEVVYYKIPRSVNRRVVANETQADEESFDYPFGGAHLRSQALETDISLDAISSAITGKKYGALPRAGMALGVLLLVGATGFYFFKSNDGEPIKLKQELGQNEPGVASEVEASVLPVLNSRTGEAPPAEAGDVANSVEASQSVQAAKVQQGVSFSAKVKKLLQENDQQGLRVLVDEQAKINSGDPYLSIVQGHLFIYSSDYSSAIEAYEKGLEADPALSADSYLADNLIVLLDHQPTRTRGLISENMSEEIVESLSERTGERGMHSRHYAVKLLADSDNRDKIDAVGMHIWDLKELEKCKDRKVSVLALRELGDPRAIPALKEVSSGSFMEQLRMTCLSNQAKLAIQEMEGS